jgi:2-methylisocitrate lyase-like PEP mutase family enzyme
MGYYETFVQLHNNPTPLLVGNVWDVMSAKIFEQQGFEAVATSSAAVAHTMGYEDGEQMPFDSLLQVVERIAKNIHIPLSVDMEGGYNRNTSGIIGNIEKLHAIGVVGINIEDSSKDHKGQMLPVDDFQRILSAIANHLAARNMKMFINARTDAYVHKLHNAVNETATRAKAYENSGANGVFVPFLQVEDEITAIVQSTSLLVSVFCIPQLPAFPRLAALGIRRISMGRAVHKALMVSLEKMVHNILAGQSFGSLY